MITPAMRPEINEYARACERLMFASNISSSFTKDELALVNYYITEVTKVVGDMARISVTTNPSEMASHNGDGTA